MTDMDVWHINGFLSSNISRSSGHGHKPFNSTTLHDIYCQKQMLDISSHPFEPQKVAIHSLPLHKVLNVLILTSSTHWHVQAHAEREREREAAQGLSSFTTAKTAALNHASFVL